MANREVFRYLKNSTGVELNALAVGTNSDFNSETINPGNYDIFGLVWDTNTISGTATTVTAHAECSPDGGTTWITIYEGAENTTGTTAGAVEFTVANDAHNGMIMLPNWFPETGQGSLDPRVRFVFDGTNITAWTVNMWLVLKNFNNKP